MNADKSPNKAQDNKPIVRVIIEKGKSNQKEYFFKDTFRIGREGSCAVQINDGLVSRDHLEISFKNGEWWVADLFSTNGTFSDGNKINHLLLSNLINLELGKNGPLISLELVSGTASKNLISSGVDGSLTTYIQRYFKSKGPIQNAGKHTQMIHEAFKVVKKKQTKKYLIIISIIATFAITAGIYSIILHIRENELKEQAVDLFYSMKENELRFNSRIDSLIGKYELLKHNFDYLVTNYYDERDAPSKYDNFLKKLGVYNKSAEDTLILKMARFFGECEINMPPEFMDSIKTYIGYWKSTPDYRKAVKLALDSNYNKYIFKTFIGKNLPPEFFYLALQESRFGERRVGPFTPKWGYAKGMWQFIAETAEHYGLKIGSLWETNAYDSLDQRFNFQPATDKAAEYIKYIYKTDAQASGLLVMASYNWGEGNVKYYINQLTKNPRDRNFWNLLSKYGDKIPDETRKYVFYIFSAAVIGENPRFFGFDFDNPLRNFNQKIN